MACRMKDFQIQQWIYTECTDGNELLLRVKWEGVKVSSTSQVNHVDTVVGEDNTNGLKVTKACAETSLLSVWADT
jgi:hypothetical protein